MCGKTMYTVLFCASAAGHYLPPLVVFAAEHLYDKWMENGPKDALYTCTPRGYLQGLNFESWFIKVFVEYVKNYQKPAVVVYDGHGSHKTLHVTIARQEKYEGLTLPERALQWDAKLTLIQVFHNIPFKAIDI